MNEVKNVETSPYVKKIIYLKNGVRQGNPNLNAQRCGAKAKSTGQPCRGMAVKGKRRCRLHGGASGSGAPEGNTNALQHGHYTRQATLNRQKEKKLLADFLALIQ
jgi:hypothetical protein